MEIECTANGKYIRGISKNMKAQQIILVVGVLTLFACTPKQSNQLIVIDETDKTESIEQIIEIDSVWAGHPVGFSLYTGQN